MLIGYHGNLISDLSCQCLLDQLCSVYYTHKLWVVNHMYLSTTGCSSSNFCHHSNPELCTLSLCVSVRRSRAAGKGYEHSPFCFLPLNAEGISSLQCLYSSTLNMFNRTSSTDRPATGAVSMIQILLAARALCSNGFPLWVRPASQLPTTAGSINSCWKWHFREPERQGVC